MQKKSSKVILYFIFICINLFVVFVNIPENYFGNNVIYKKLKGISNLYYPQAWHFFSPDPITSSEVLNTNCLTKSNSIDLNVYSFYVKNIKKIPFDPSGEVYGSIRNVSEKIITEINNHKIAFCKNKHGNCEISIDSIHNLPSYENARFLSQITCKKIAPIGYFYFQPIISIRYSSGNSKNIHKIIDTIKLKQEEAISDL